MINCFFAMFDIIGFSNLIKINGTKDLYKLYRRNILPMLQHAAMPQSKQVEINGEINLIPDQNSQRVYYNFFSDTIVFYSKDDSLDSFFNIIFTSLELLKSGFGGLKNPYRGAIGYGNIITDEMGILVGTSIIDAYKGEQSQMWSGCILTEDCENFCLKNNYLDLFYKIFDDALKNELDYLQKIKLKNAQKTLVKFNVKKQNKNIEKPIEYIQKEHIVLDWTQGVYEGASEVSFYPSDIHHQKMIKQNTIEFEKWARLHNKITN